MIEVDRYDMIWFNFINWEYDDMVLYINSETMILTIFFGLEVKKQR